jgi:hypothetical protein
MWCESYQSSCLSCGASPNRVVACHVVRVLPEWLLVMWCESYLSSCLSCGASPTWVVVVMYCVPCLSGCCHAVESYLSSFYPQQRSSEWRRCWRGCWRCRAWNALVGRGQSTCGRLAIWEVQMYRNEQHQNAKRTSWDGRGSLRIYGCWN